MIHLSQRTPAFAGRHSSRKLTLPLRQLEHQDRALETVLRPHTSIRVSYNEYELVRSFFWI